MIKASISLQDLRRKIYLKAKAEKRWRFWGLYVHVCKMETLQEAYRMAKRNNGAPGIDGVLPLRPLKKQVWRLFLNRYNVNWSPARIILCETEEKKFPKKVVRLES